MFTFNLFTAFGFRDFLVNFKLWATKYQWIGTDIDFDAFFVSRISHFRGIKKLKILSGQIRERKDLIAGYEKRRFFVGLTCVFRNSLEGDVVDDGRLWSSLGVDGE